MSFNNICDFLDAVEEIYPIPSHTDLLQTWEEDVREYWFDCLGPEGPSLKEQQMFESVIAFRKVFHSEALFKEADTLQIEKSWEWLLTTTQVEQRTESWYREKENMLTASEIAQIWSGPLTRARLIKSKVPKPDSEYGPFIPRLAVPRAIQSAMDWGVRYEPVVKGILEKKLNLKINDLGRIPHKTIPRLAASPDGLITEGPEELVGRLIEIKCPTSRKIKDDEVPFEYWAQMQIQLEVCDLEACEFVEAKFAETDAEDPTAEGWIALEQNEETSQYKYIYSESPLTEASEEGWNLIESYGWKVVELRRVTQHRDRNWFAGIQKDLEAFWNDVKGAREGTWIPPPPRVKKQKIVKCAIVDIVDEPITQNQESSDSHKNYPLTPCEEQSNCQERHE
jgi:putative phage-type endonuclease